MDAAIAAVLSELGGILIFIEEHESSFSLVDNMFFGGFFKLPAVFRLTLQRT